MDVELQLAYYAQQGQGDAGDSNEQQWLGSCEGITIRSPGTVFTRETGCSGAQPSRDRRWYGDV